MSPREAGGGDVNIRDITASHAREIQRDLGVARDQINELRATCTELRATVERLTRERDALLAVVEVGAADGCWS